MSETTEQKQTQTQTQPRFRSASRATLGDQLVEPLASLLGLDEPEPEITGRVDPSSLDTAPPEDGQGGDGARRPSSDAFERIDTGRFDYRERGTQRSGDGFPLIAGRYRVLGDIGQGGMARVLRVEHVELGKQFAMKVISTEWSGDVAVRRQFMREAQVASQMDHPSIVQITDFGGDDNVGAFIVMEYLRGEPLSERLQRSGHLRIAAAADIALQVAEAIHYMHGKNFVHCDLKPDNIFLVAPQLGGRRKNRAKIIDFGLSRAAAGGAQLARSEVGGTPCYMAPEQIRGLAPQASMDIYALGVIFYEMLVGEPPFLGAVAEVMAAQLHDAPTVPSSRTDEPIDERADQLILKALHKDPLQRHQSVGQFIFELRTLMEMLGLKRRRRASTSRRSGGATNTGVEDQLVFSNCPCPLFRIDNRLKIITSNASFGHFVGADPEKLRGKLATETLLGTAYPELREDILSCLEQHTDLQRMFTFEVPKAGGTEQVTVLLWLVRELHPQTGAITFSGVIVPQYAVST